MRRDVGNKKTPADRVRGVTRAFRAAFRQLGAFHRADYRGLSTAPLEHYRFLMSMGVAQIFQGIDSAGKQLRRLGVALEFQ